MPALITHYLHSMEVTQKLEDKNINVEAAASGAQGPDIFYFHRLIPIIQMGKSYRKVGTKLHYCDPDRILCLMAEYIINNPNDKIAYSYAIGFICHYSLDRIAHPYVYAMQAEMIISANNSKCFEGFIHSKIEHSLDVIMLREKKNLNGAEYNAVNCLTKDKSLIEDWSRLLKFVIDNLLPNEKVESEKIVQAFFDLRLCQRLLYDPHLYKSAIFGFLEKILHKGPLVTSFIRPVMEDGMWDYSNFEKGEWRSPYKNEIVRNQSFFELFDEAVDDSLKLIEKFNDKIIKKDTHFEITGKISFKTGIPQNRKLEELY